MGSNHRSSSKQRISTVKANWTPEVHELFVDLCLEQVALGNRPGTHFTKPGWKSILDAFRTMTGLNYDKVQLKNHWDLTKKHWRIWHKLVSAESMKWDPDTRTFGATNEEWIEYIKGNPDAAAFQHKELPLADKLDTVFVGTPDSVLIETPIQRKHLYIAAAEPTPRRRKHNNYAPVNEPPPHFRNHQYGSPNAFLPVEEPVVARPECNVDRFDTVESRSVITVQSPPPKLSYSIEECIKSLDSIEEVEQGGDLYLFALDIFLNKDYREIFLNLKKSSTKIAWLQRLQSSGQTLPLH